MRRAPRPCVLRPRPPHRDPPADYAAESRRTPADSPLRLDDDVAVDRQSFVRTMRKLHQTATPQQVMKLGPAWRAAEADRRASSPAAPLLPGSSSDHQQRSPALLGQIQCRREQAVRQIMPADRIFKHPVLPGNVGQVPASVQEVEQLHASLRENLDFAIRCEHQAMWPPHSVACVCGADSAAPWEPADRTAL